MPYITIMTLDRFSRKCINMVIALITILGMWACVDEHEYADNPRGNFEALWKIIDEHYCFFDYKQAEYGLDWNAVHDKYSKQISDGRPKHSCSRYWATCLPSCATDTSIVLVVGHRTQLVVARGLSV